MLYYVYNLVYFNCVLSIKVAFIVVDVLVAVVVTVVVPRNIPSKFDQNCILNDWHIIIIVVVFFCCCCC